MFSERTGLLQLIRGLHQDFGVYSSCEVYGTLTTALILELEQLWFEFGGLFVLLSSS
jgi:hypothetical protein